MHKSDCAIYNEPAFPNGKCDCGEEKMPNFKKIRDYSPEELNSSVEQAELYLKDKGLEFYKILNGIDAYFERRKRKENQVKLSSIGFN